MSFAKEHRRTRTRLHTVLLLPWQALLLLPPPWTSQFSSHAIPPAYGLRRVYVEPVQVRLVDVP
eukprot:3370289-Rhodomonas_salina.1